MRLKTFTLFLAIQVLSFFIWQTAFSEKTAVIEPAQTVHAASDEARLHPDFTARNISDSQIRLDTANKNQIKSALDKLPAEHANTVRNIILDYSPNAYRGLGGNNLIILRGIAMDAKELVGVLVHETGHNVDYGYLTHKKTEKKSAFKDGSLPVYITDPSVDFYRISWEDEFTLKNTASNLDFVSGYAMTDPFEDFAETYTYYVLHNADFKALAASSPKLYAKYRFMRYRVFDGVEFDMGDGEVNMNSRPWDITLLGYDLNAFLG